MTKIKLESLTKEELEQKSEQLKNEINTLKNVIEASNTTVFDFKRHPIRFIKGVRLRFKLLTKDEKKFFKSILKKLRRSFYHILKLKIKRKIYRFYIQGIC